MAFLKKKDLIIRVTDLNRELPAEITQAAAELIIKSMADSLAEGREVCLRGFGRFIPRFYTETRNKKTGLLFHPSPRLLDGDSGDFPASEASETALNEDDKDYDEL
ncbi:MAG: HU family DNA-binding protein [Deltaproteobacteria bacterium]|jgi:nucleoid DNA-binding protein|nr:HU family DNA-binding protein [Deltaproteobacteria bacterium]